MASTCHRPPLPASVVLTLSLMLARQPHPRLQLPCISNCFLFEFAKSLSGFGTFFNATSQPHLQVSITCLSFFQPTYYLPNKYCKNSPCIHGCCEWFWHFLLCKATTPFSSQPVRLCGAGRAKKTFQNSTVTLQPTLTRLPKQLKIPKK